MKKGGRGKGGDKGKKDFLKLGFCNVAGIREKDKEF